MKKINIAQCIGAQVRRLFLATCALAAALIFTGASIWEGSATVSVAGELPQDAYYAATNSFPPNTVVEVTNLEIGMAIRVIVTTSLDSPGLLAMLSQNAASAIGIPTQGIGRIRMKESLGTTRTEEASAPIANSRFPDERERQGNPGLTPAAPAATPIPPAERETPRTAAAEDPVSATPEDRFYSNVINQPESYTPEPVDYPADGAVRVEPQPNWVSGQGESTQPFANEPYPASSTPYSSIPDAQAAPGSPPFSFIPEESAQALPPSVPAAQTPQTAVTPSSSSPIIILGPAEERPPQGGIDIPPGTIIGPIPLHQVSPWLSGDDAAPDSRYFIGPIVPNQQSATVPNQQSATVPWRTPPTAVSPTPPSIPMVTQLEKGKYYVQIGAFTRTDILETVAARFSKSYPLAVQSGGSPGSVYRLLVGPLNAGESGAVLQRVKNSGYPDAFVRNGS
jgi:hypothetical protein